MSLKYSQALPIAIRNDCRLAAKSELAAPKLIGGGGDSGFSATVNDLMGPTILPVSVSLPFRDPMPPPWPLSPPGRHRSLVIFWLLLD